MIESAVYAVVGIVAIGVPIAGTVWWVGRLGNRHRSYIDELAERGPTYTGHVLVHLAMIIFWAAAMFGGIALIPFLVWVGTGDAEGRRVFIVMLVVSAATAVVAALVAWPGLKAWILEPDGITQRYVFRERHIPYASIVELRERASLTGSLEIRSPENRIRVPMHISGYDDFFNRLRRSASHAVFRGRGAATENEGDPIITTARFAVPRRRLVFVAGVLGAMLLFFWIWPWFLVTGDHPVRDSFIFMAIGTLLWAAFAFLIGVETFQRHQPVELEMRPGELAFRTLRSDWKMKRDLELVSASVETRIVVIKGQRGYRHPLVMVFTDGDRVELDQFRARHMGTTTHRLAAELQRRYWDPSFLSDAYRDASDQWLARAEVLVEQGRDVEAVESYQHAIATYPDPPRLNMLRIVGDLQRRGVDLVGAISSYEAHLDFAPDDTDAWQGLAAAYIDIGWPHLASDATARTERLLLAPAPRNVHAQRDR